MAPSWSSLAKQEWAWWLGTIEEMSHGGCCSDMDRLMKPRLRPALKDSEGVPMVSACPGPTILESDSARIVTAMNSSAADMSELRCLVMEAS